MPPSTPWCPKTAQVLHVTLLKWVESELQNNEKYKIKKNTMLHEKHMKVHCHISFHVRVKKKEIPVKWF